MRERVAALLVNLALRINPPTVTEYPVQDFNIHIGPFGGDLSSYEAQMRAQRLSSHGRN